MNGRTFARAAATVTSLGIGAVLTFAGPAAAAPDASVDQAVAHLTERAGTDQAARAGVEALGNYTKLVDVAQLRDIAGNWAPFAYAAPTFGCGTHGPITTIIAAGTTEGVNPHQGATPEPGTLRFSATPSHSGAPLTSGLVVAWVNVNNGRSGLDPLDDVTEFNLPTLSKTVHSGPGTVIASMWGIIGYPGAHCVMTPTVGTFVVPDAPPAAPAPAPAAPAPAAPAPAAPAPAVPAPVAPNP
ncbi:hypothetical protein SAMN04244553_2238 [Nocardia amikacinitolerans]|uniref:Uncharacterized protein n=1 Tax=Nocardia amikacinitolerans TaxID=756689 RepID=A0A285LAN6_9NOCA|nr:hypothetical protein [Nocardia amikacinitolerans]SNY80666.1 hypothetical protein SAMN04244553_2238 [Nocardia amikacinitolerans]